MGGRVGNAVRSRWLTVGFIFDDKRIHQASTDEVGNSKIRGNSKVADHITGAFYISSNAPTCLRACIDRCIPADLPGPEMGSQRIVLRYKYSSVGYGWDHRQSQLTGDVAVARGVS